MVRVERDCFVLHALYGTRDPAKHGHTTHDPWHTAHGPHVRRQAAHGTRLHATRRVTQRHVAPWQVEALDVSGNAFGVQGAQALVDALAGTKVRTLVMSGTPLGAAEGALAVAVGRFTVHESREAEIIKDPDSDQDIVVRYLDDGSESGYIKASAVAGCVTATAGELATFERRFELFGALAQALAATKLRELAVSGCGIGPTAMSLLAEALSDAEVRSHPARE